MGFFFNRGIRSPEKLANAISELWPNNWLRDMVLRDHPSWSETRAGGAVADYRKFLYLIGTNRGKTLVPWRQDIDDVWHAHLLSNKDYNSTCKRLFGRIVYHDRNLGASEQEAIRNTEAALSALYDRRFVFAGWMWRNNQPLPMDEHWFKSSTSKSNAGGTPFAGTGVGCGAASCGCAGCGGCA